MAQRRATSRGADQTYVALLRGINLGARNKVAMPRLRELVAGLDGRDVQTYVQSGNVVFKSGRSAGELQGAIERTIERELGLTVTVLLRTKAQLMKVAGGNPFADGKHPPTTLHVTFLSEPPQRRRVRELDPGPFAPDEFAVKAREVYLHCPNGYGRSKLTNAFFEKRLGVAATTRNWRTVTALVELVTT